MSIPISIVIKKRRELTSQFQSTEGVAHTLIDRYNVNGELTLPSPIVEAFFTYLLPIFRQAQRRRPERSPDNTSGNDDDANSGSERGHSTILHDKLRRLPVTSLPPIWLGTILTPPADLFTSTNTPPRIADTDAGSGSGSGSLSPGIEFYRYGQHLAKEDVAGRCRRVVYSMVVADMFESFRDVSTRGDGQPLQSHASARHHDAFYDGLLYRQDEPLTEEDNGVPSRRQVREWATREKRMGNALRAVEDKLGDAAVWFLVAHCSESLIRNGLATTKPKFAKTMKMLKGNKKIADQAWYGEVKGRLQAFRETLLSLREFEGFADRVYRDLTQ